MKEGYHFDDALRAKIREAIRTGLSPRHIPQFIVGVDELPVTVNGKKVETAVKKAISEGRVKEVSSTIANPEVLRGFVRFATYEGDNQRRTKRREAKL